MDLLKIIAQNTHDIKNLKKAVTCCGSTSCPTLSADPGNTLVCNPDGLFSAGGGGTLTGALNGTSITGTNVVLGQDVGAVGNPAALTSNREIPMGAFTIKHDDTSGNFNTFGAGTLVSTRVSGGTNITSNNTVTSNSNTFGLLSTNTVTFGAFNNVTTYNTSIFAVKRFNTVSTGQTITTGVSNRQSAVFAILQFENDVAATNNPITQSGANPISVYSSKIDFWPNAGGQTKTVTGSLCHYSTYLDCTLVINSSIQNYMDFEAGFAVGAPGFPTTITNRYGFKVLDLNPAGFITTNRWAFYQEGATDRNYFAGSVGIGSAITAPTAKLHIGAGTATANTAPLKLTSGVNLTTPEDGSFEYDGVNLYFTVGSTRKTVTLV